MAVRNLGQNGLLLRRLMQSADAGRLSIARYSHSAFRTQSLRPSRPSVSLELAQLRCGYSTGPSTSQGSNNPNHFPPPGFDVEKAKQPLSKETQSPATSSKQPPTSSSILRQLDSIELESKELEKRIHDVSVAEAAEKGQVEEKKEPKKLTIGQKIKKEIQHYWDGTKLLAAEVKISSKLALKMAAGYELSRRENRQLKRTVRDLARLVPFSAFVIIPFAELLLPVALKLFPNLLPSTYEGQKSKDDKAAILRGTRKEVSNFLQGTLRETGLPLSPMNAKKEEFTEFFRKVRATGETPSDEDVIAVCKIFKDDLTLDNLSRPQLVAMCKYMNLNTFGTDAMLRYTIRVRMRQIKRDDRAIAYEGVDSLLIPELQMACASRGLRTHGLSPARLRDDLSMWLDLRLKQGVPSTLLVLSNAYMYTQHSQEYEISSQMDALRSVLSSIPEELFHEIELEVHNAEGAATNRQRLEVVKEQQELIEEENEQITENGNTGMPAPKDHEDIDEKEDKHMDASSGAESTSQPEKTENDTTAEKEPTKQDQAEEKKQ
ncbi:LETM1-domain-containing protein [Trichophyton interdigitale]|uniref:LETM1-domain-containing protein n=1 Tax=Trichophyton interdigitale TaxID=101480 RepID=A0A9P5CX65_9EURO|nr:LETM1-domain-containing protein [Trichophyton interdigitale]KAF3899523.1 LETM1-domain-containing protein [Trichophyton interdigitale]KAG8210955.1 LETM1-domain-containing protein [Trichophyton interdigitale]